MATLARRRSSREDEPEEDRDARPTRRRRTPAEDEPDETPRRSRRSRDDCGEDDAPKRGRSRGRSRDAEPEDDEPRRGRRSRGADEGRSGRRSRGARGFGSFESRKSQTSSRADEFKPGADKPTLIKFLEEEPFDSYNQHWIESRDLPRDVKRNSYMCFDDKDYFGEDPDFDEGCPLCQIGEGAKTYSLFNVLNLSNPRKPEVQVWTAPPGVSEKLLRASKDKKTSPLNREDLYFEVELVKSKNKSEWTLTPVKARDLEEDFDMEPLDEAELVEFEADLFKDRADVTKVDTFEELGDLADSLD